MIGSILTVVTVCPHCWSSWPAGEWALAHLGHWTYCGLDLKVYSSAVFLVPPWIEEEQRL